MNTIVIKCNFLLICCLFLWTFCLSVPAVVDARADAINPYLQQLIERAREKKLSESRRWHLLLHYQKDIFGNGVTSFAIGSGFFIAIDGKTNPQRELEATLKSFFSKKNLKVSKQPPQCTFPARYYWLKSQLRFDPEKLPEQKCPQIEEYLSKIKAERISLIVAATSMHDPASIWGHVFFKLAPQKTDDWKEGYTFTYAADIPENQRGPIDYIYRGVFGGYPGTMRIIPYNEQVAIYNEVESRDIWEYDLNFNQEEITYMTLHVWELGSTYFPYYFFKENCAFFLLTMLEVSKPELDLTSQISLRTVPSVLLRILKDTPGLIKERHYYPSRMSQVQYAMGLLADAEKEIVLDPQNNLDYFDSTAFLSQESTRRYLILQASIAYSKYKFVNEPSDAWLDTLDILQKKQAETPDEGEGFSVPYRPGLEEGHDLLHVNIRGGRVNTGHSFAEIGVSSHFHDLLSDNTGFPSNATLNILSLQFRYEEEEDKTDVEYFDILDVVSLSPISAYYKKLSWKARVGWKKTEDLENDKLPFSLGFGIGAATESDLFIKETYYFFLEPFFQAGGMFDNGYRTGLSCPLGVILDITSIWSVSLFARPVFYFSDDYADFEEYRIDQKIFLSKNSELRISWKNVEKYAEASLGFGQHF